MSCSPLFSFRGDGTRGKNTMKKFSNMTIKEKTAFVNSGTGKKLTLAQSKFKTKGWPIMISIKRKQVPKDTLGQLAYNFFN